MRSSWGIPGAEVGVPNCQKSFALAWQGHGQMLRVFWSEGDGCRGGKAGVLGRQPHLLGGTMAAEQRDPEFELYKVQLGLMV